MIFCRHTGQLICEMPVGPLFGVPSVGLNTRLPPVANVSYACAMSSGVTPIFIAPRIIAGLGETGERIPMCMASLATRLVPVRPSAWSPRREYTELSE